MVKKRKLRSSEPEPEAITTPEPEQIQTQSDEQQQSQIEQEQEQEVVEQQTNEEDQEEEADEEQEEELHQHMEEDKDNENEEEEEEKEAAEGQIAASTERSEAANGGEENGGDGELEEEPVEKILEPFSKEQLLLLLKEAVSKHPDFVETVDKLADADPARRKIFVHGLGWDTNTETLTGVFGKYGEIEDCKAVTDKVSGKSKGYGFILFKHRSGARKALKQPQKMIGNRMTSCQLASAGPVPAPPPTAPPVSEFTQRKIFVSNVSAELDPQKLLEYFGTFGEIEDGPLGLDRQTGKPKGFALFVYKTVDGAKKALEEPHKNYEGHMLHCQKAVDGPKQNKPFYQQQQQQHHSSSSSSSYNRKDYNKPKYPAGGGGGSGHLMAPSGPSMGFNPAAVAPAALGQALTAFLATQGAGLGITNLFGGLGGGAPPVNQGVPPMMNNAAGYGIQGGGYGNQPVMQGGYQNPQMGQQGGPGRSQPGNAPYAGQGH